MDFNLENVERKVDQDILVAAEDRSKIFHVSRVHYQLATILFIAAINTVFHCITAILHCNAKGIFASKLLLITSMQSKLFLVD